MNKYQKLFYRYKFEQQIPYCIRNNITKVSIHDVINSKTMLKQDNGSLVYRVNGERVRCFPADIAISVKKDFNLEKFIYKAFNLNHRGMLRVCFNRFPDKVIEMFNNDKLYIRDCDGVCNKSAILQVFKVYNYISWGKVLTGEL